MPTRRDAMKAAAVAAAGMMGVTPELPRVRYVCRTVAAPKVPTRKITYLIETIPLNCESFNLGEVDSWSAVPYRFDDSDCWLVTVDYIHANRD